MASPQPNRSDYGADAMSWASSPGVRSRMQQQGGRDTQPEVQLRRELHRRGHRFRLQQRVVPGTRRRRVDITFPGAKVAVFVDGCFWHGCDEHGRREHQVNGWYWPAKIEGNRQRDRDTDERLADAGWLVIRVWEHEALAAAADRISSALKDRESGVAAPDRDEGED